MYAAALQRGFRLINVAPIPEAEAKYVHRLEALTLMEHHKIVDKVQNFLWKVQ